MKALKSIGLLILIAIALFALLGLIAIVLVPGVMM